MVLFLQGEDSMSNKHNTGFKLWRTFDDDYENDLVFAGPQEQGPALGQVLVIAFSVSQKCVLQKNKLEHQMIPLVIKAHWDDPYWKFPGGMLKSRQTFEQAAINELRQETGVIASEKNLLLLHTWNKQQHKPHPGTFPVKTYAVFNCNFSQMYDPLRGERGDEREVVGTVPFWDITGQSKWSIPVMPEVQKPFFPQFLPILQIAQKQIVA